MHFNKIKLGNHSVFFSFFISYICILAVPIIIGSMIYSQSQNIITSEVSQAKTAMLKQLQQTMDIHLRDMEQVYMKIGLDPKVLGVMNGGNQNSPEQRFMMNEAIKNLNMYAVTNSFIKKHFIYFKGTGLILSSDASYDSEQYFESHLKNKGMVYREWVDFLNMKHIKDYIPQPEKNRTDANNGSVIFVQSLPMEYPHAAKSTLVIQLNEEIFTQSIKNIEWENNSFVYIINRKNQVMFSSKEFTLLDSLKFDTLESSNQKVHEILNGEKVIVFHIDSKVNDWKYVMVMPENIAMGKPGFIRNLAVIGLLICILLSTLQVFFFTRKNYNPINDIIKSISQKAETPPEQEMNEFRFIHKAISKSFDEKELLKKRLDQQKDIMRNNFLARLIKGRLENSIPISDACEAYSIQLVGDDFLVILFYIENIGDCIMGKNPDSSVQAFRLANFIIRNVVEELVGVKNKGYVVEVDEVLVCLINFYGSDDGNRKSEVLQIVVRAKEFIEKNFHIVFSTAISGIHKTIIGIPAAYHEAIEALEYKVLFGEGDIIHYDDIEMSFEKSMNYSNSFKSEQQLVNCIKAGDYSNAQKILDMIVENSLIKGSGSISMAKYRMFGLINTIINAIAEISFICEDEFLKRLNFIDRLLNCSTVKGLQREVKHIFEEIDEYIRGRNDSLNTKLGDEIINFIQCSYHDANLSVSVLADRFNMSMPQLSKFFRKQTGTGVLEYIHKVRVEKAKVLLSYQSMTISEVSLNVGFSDSDTFIRVFKKLEGITPGKYKEIIKD